MKFGLTTSEYNFILEQVVFPLQKQAAIVFCYGSRARGDHKKFSDLDLMVESPSDLTKEISFILETLENSNFPYKVDLVQLSDFAQSYKPSYEKDKVRFQT